MNEKYPFSRAFGLANTREVTVESAQKVYDKLMLGYDDSRPLPFSVFSVKALDENGQLDDAKIKSLIRLFRPDREGYSTRLDYTTSIDTVYKELRLLRASIANSAQIDIAFEKIVNAFFYFFLVIVAVTILGIKIWSVRRLVAICTVLSQQCFLTQCGSNIYRSFFLSTPSFSDSRFSLEVLHRITLRDCSLYSCVGLMILVTRLVTFCCLS